MLLALRFVAVCSAVLFACATAGAQPPAAPEPHLALDELVKEYKRLGLPLPPANAELVRLKWNADTPPCLGFRFPPAKPGDEPQYLIGTKTYPWYPPGEHVKNSADALRNVEPAWVADLLCTAAQCRSLGLNELAEAIYARGLEATAKPVPLKPRTVFSAWGTFQVPPDVWRLHSGGPNRSAHLELRHAAFVYWHGQIMAPASDRKEVLRYLQAADISHPDIRDLERTVAPRKSKPGTAEALIDDLTEYKSRDRGFGPPGLYDQYPGEAAYWKLAEMGFDAVPALLDHLQDSRFTRQGTGDGNFFTGVEWRLSSPTHVGHLTRYLVGHFTGPGVIFGIYPDPRVDVIHEWWEKARKVGEEKWLLSLALPEARDDAFAAWGPDRVVLRVLGVKYPGRLAEIYRTVLRERSEVDSWALVREIAASKLPRAEQLALLAEGAEHKRLVHRNSALAILARIDAPLFRKHLLATLKKLPPDVERVLPWPSPQTDLAGLLWKTDDPTCWDALATAASWSPVDLRIKIIREFDWSNPKEDKPTRRELLRFLIGFLSDDSATKGDEDHPAVCVRDVAAEALAKQLALNLPYNPERGPVGWAFVRAAVAKAAAEELERLKR